MAVRLPHFDTTIPGHSVNFPLYQQPVEIGNFSIDGSRNYCPDPHNLKYLHLPPSTRNLQLDLNRGFENAIKKDFYNFERLDSIIKWIALNKESVQTRPPNFVFYRGLMTTLLCTPYEKKEPWCIGATLFRNTIYLCKFPTEYDFRQQERRTERDERMAFWGLKFEQYLMAGSPTEEPNPETQLNQNEEYCIVVKTRLNGHKIVMAAEVDGLEGSSRHPGSTSNYIELKTTRLITTDVQDYNFCKYKLIKWWSQSFTVGIKRIYAGFRDDEGIVRSLRVYDIKSIPHFSEVIYHVKSHLFEVFNILHLYITCHLYI
ncbi:DXO [Cordylochernes scorpioides]|uniref:Decapping nuclease n=1 Tax=Cordylochernes scorpioides TaxID=51811 RepID=A0ABY6LM45_9ARAC|nr:DXO [Cordylochernes scorpioides]